MGFGMVSKMSVMPGTNVKFRGIFNYSEFMQSIKNWFKDYDYEFQEPTHKWKVPSEGVEAEIKMTGERKVNEYVKYHITVSIRIWDMKDVEVVKDGQKMKLQDGKVSVDVEGKLEFDWQNRFGGNKFLQHAQDFLHKFIIKQDIGDWWEDDLLIKTMDLTKTIRHKLGHEAISKDW